MLQLLQPIWLFAMAGIIVPVMIHLWNSKQGKVLAIGSIALLERTSRKKARSRVVSEWLLLLLRCLLLMSLALLLAGPYWKREPGADKKGWVLVGDAPAGGHTRVMMDSLLQQGYQRHDIKDSSWWEAFAGLDRQAPACVPFYVFTDGYLRHFSGVRPATARPVYWYTDMARDSTVRWVDKAWPVGRDSVRVITGVNGLTGSSYRYEDMLRQPGSSVDTAILRVVVYADGIDGQWVISALRAIQQFTRRNIMISKKMVDADWVFWLSSQPLPPDLKAANILLYEPGKVIPVDTWMRDMGVQVEKMIGQPVQSGKLQPVWIDGFGRPLLGLETTAGGNRYHFFSHFDPAWNGLVWSADFPLYLQSLLFEREDNDHDIRAIDPAQVAPEKRGVVDKKVVVDEGIGGTVSPKEAAIDLAPAGWLLVWLLLLVERLVAFKRSKDHLNG